MKRIIIICEGQTEQEFCNTILYSKFQENNIYLQATLPKKSGGGIVKWEHLEKDINNYLKSDKNVFITTFIDYYKLPDSYPNYRKAHANTDKNKIIDEIEHGIAFKIDSPRFIPYIQLHEFESLLFNNLGAFDSVQGMINDMGLLKKTLADYPDNSELINHDKSTAPSKRLDKIIKGYNKVKHGNLIAQHIGLANMFEKNLRFKKWIENLLNKNWD